MDCPECLAELNIDARFCDQCGADVGRASREKKRRSPSVTRKGKRALAGSTPLADRDETVLWRGSFSAKGLIHSWLLAILLTIVMPTGGAYVNADRTEWMVIIAILALVWGGLALLLCIQKLNINYELRISDLFIVLAFCYAERTASN